MQTLEQYSFTLKSDFAFYGLAACPLSDEEIHALWALGVPESTAYAIGCDVNSGFTILESIVANLAP